MTQQLSLYDYQVLGAPSNGTETSAAAAYSIREYVSQMEWRVLECLQRHGPCTQERISILTGLHLQTVNPRVNALAKPKYDENRHLTRPALIVAAPEPGYTRSGRKAVVWLISPAAQPADRQHNST